MFEKLDKKFGVKGHGVKFVIGCAAFCVWCGAFISMKASENGTSIIYETLKIFKNKL